MSGEYHQLRATHLHPGILYLSGPGLALCSGWCSISARSEREQETSMTKSRRLFCSLVVASFGIVGTRAFAAEPVHGVTDNEIVVGTVTDLSGVTAIQGVNNA